MTNGTVDEWQRRAAKVVGFSYLLAMATAVFHESVRGTLIVANDAAATAQNIMAHERLWHLGIASNLLCMLTDVALIAALYVILKRVNQSLAVFAAFMRVIETAIGVTATLISFDVVRYLSGADYLNAFGTDQLQALAMIPIGAYRAGINVCFVFLGVGSTVFCYLWFKSSYIPRALAALGVIGSSLIATGSFAIVILPDLATTLSMTYMMPLGLFEVAMGFWLLIKGIRPYRTAGAGT